MIGETGRDRRDVFPNPSNHGEGANSNATTLNSKDFGWAGRGNQSIRCRWPDASTPGVHDSP
jgi:hypothetical protein